MTNSNHQPIICGTDFSENARQAADVAAALAIRLDVTLLLVHGIQLLMDGAAQSTFDAIIQSYRDRLREEGVRLRALGARVEEIMADDAPDVTFGRLALQRHARLLVVSSLGQGRGGRWLLGSVSERSAETSPVPTLLVRDAGPLLAWARGERPLRVSVGTDFTASSDAALQWLAQLRQLGPCDVTACYVDWPPEEAARLGVAGPLGEAGGNQPTLQTMLERDLTKKVSMVLGDDVRIRVKGNLGRTDLPLIALAVEAKADLLVVGTHQARGLDRLRHVSVSRGVLHEAPMSVACVPASGAVRVKSQPVRECQRVLVAVDLSESPSFAVPHGYAIAHAGGTVRLMHNSLPFRLPYPDWPVTAEAAGPDDYIAESQARLRDLEPEDAAARGITTELEVTTSWETAEAICAAAERFGADVICLGAHTRPGLKARILGSVSLSVLQNSRRPVLVVWPGTP